MPRSSSSLLKKSWSTSLLRTQRSCFKSSGVSSPVRSWTEKVEMSLSTLPWRRWKSSLRKNMVSTRSCLLAHLKSTLKQSAGCFTGFWFTLSPPRIWPILGYSPQSSLTKASMEPCSWMWYNWDLSLWQDTWLPLSFWRMDSQTTSTRSPRMPWRRSLAQSRLKLWPKLRLKMLSVRSSKLFTRTTI